MECLMLFFFYFFFSEFFSHTFSFDLKVVEKNANAYDKTILPGYLELNLGYIISENTEQVYI